VRIQDLAIDGALPVRRFAIDTLSDVVVVAGPNGVGKTRLLSYIVGHLRGGTPAANVQGHVAATHPREADAWGGRESLDMSNSADMDLFRATIQTNRRRTKWQSSLVNFESDRTIQNLRPFQFTWDLPDPLEEEVSWETTFGFMHDRFQDTLNSMFRIIEAQKQSIANRAVALRREGRDSMKLEFDDPMKPFKELFAQLLGPKELVDPSARDQRLQYRLDGQELEFATLSSGEREVVNIAFDFQLRAPEDCIVFFDEPELHLHPELSYRLIQALQTIGQRNQFFLSTHSPDVITAALDRSVVFIKPAQLDKGGEPVNQAMPVKEDDETNQALRMLGQSIGIVALGKRIVLVEGTASSLDKQTYGSILRGRFPQLVLVPSGGKHVVESFRSIYEAVLSRTIWGVDFFMLSDRDSAPDPAEASAVAASASGVLQVLPRYHLENYFLDENVWALAFAPLEASGSWLRKPKAIRARIRSIAEEYVSYATALFVSARFRMAAGNVDLMPADCHGKSMTEVVALLQERAQSEGGRIASALDLPAIQEASEKYFSLLSESITTDSEEWKKLVPGKPILGRFARAAAVDQARARTMYINAVQERRVDAFDEIIAIFERFATT